MYSLKTFLTALLYAAQRCRSIAAENDTLDLLEFTDRFLAGEDDCLMIGGLERALKLFEREEPPERGMFTSVFTMIQHSELLSLEYFLRRSFVPKAVYTAAPPDIPDLPELIKMDWTDVKGVE